MSSIAERIKQKLEAFDQYNLEETEENNTIQSETEDESKTVLETLNIERIKSNSVRLKESKEEYITKYINENNIELFAYSRSCKNFEKENFDKNNNLLLLENDINYKINEYVTSKLNMQALSSPGKNSIKDSYNKKQSLILINKNYVNNNNNNNNLNYQTNYSTDHTQNIDNNEKIANFNYIELGNSCEDPFEYDADINNLSSHNMNVMHTINHDETNINKASESNILRTFNREKSINFSENFNFTLRKLTSLGKDSCENNEGKEFDEIILHDSESFFYQKFDEASNSINNNKNDKTSLTEENVKEKSLWRKIFLPSFYFLEEFMFISFMVLLLILDPIIVFFLKSFDFVYAKIFYCLNKNDYSKVDNVMNNNNNNNHLLFCYEIEEIGFNKITNFDESIDNKNNTMYEKYFNYFFNNCSYKKQRNIIKITFIVIALLMNLYILTSFQEKSTKLILFFLNNLYLLYHTMDLYNEKLLNYTENIGWSKIINKI